VSGAPPPPRHPDRAGPRRLWAVLAVVWLVALVYVALHMDREWVPHDAGVLGQSAERVLHGQLPHRDFIEAYTGGLSFLNALAFSLFGVRLIVLRWVLFGFVALWIPALFYVASRFARPLAAGAVVLLAVAWSVPNYPAPLPSWYNLFFATFGAAALLRYLEVERPVWLVVAGVAGGLSLLVKIAGLYYVAGVLLFLVYHEQVHATRETPAARRGAAYQLLLAGGVLLFLALLVRMIKSEPGVAGLVEFVVPPAAVGLLLLWEERGADSGASGPRVLTLLRLTLPFALGLVLALLPLVLVYARDGALHDLYAGVFTRPLARLSAAAMLPAPLLPSLFATLPLLVLLARDCGTARWTGLERLAIGVALVSGLIAAGQNAPVHRMVWYSVRALVPVVAVVGTAVLLHPRLGAALSPLRREQLVLLLAVTATVALVQFPFSAPIYFCYVAPLLVLTIAAVLASVGGLGSFAAVSTWGFYLLFATLFVNRTSVFTQGQQHTPEAVAPLALPRAGIRVPVIQGQIYERLVAEIERRAAGDAYIYATPDCPEVYFLSGKRNPTRNLFEFLNPHPLSPDQTLALLERRGVHVVVISHVAEFSTMDPALDADLAARFPNYEVITPFVLRWRS
jgi:hypothetical protein